MKRNNIIFAGIILSAVIVAYMFMRETSSEITIPDSFATTTPSIDTAYKPVYKAFRVPPAGLKEYRSNLYGFSLFYPESMKVDLFDEGNGAATITFEDVDEGNGFQIFIVPYLEKQVSKERFIKDLPSGVREDSKDGRVDGAVAAFFYSKHEFLGDTREIWFVHNNLLYEITTVKVLDSWLDSIVQTWKFL